MSSNGIVARNLRILDSKVEVDEGFKIIGGDGGTVDVEGVAVQSWGN